MQYMRFEELPVWKKAKELAVRIYKATQQGKFVKDFSLTQQIGRSSISISCNIAEGFERGSQKEFIQFLYIAKGSAGELRTQLLLATELGYLDEKISKDLRNEVIQTSEQLGALIMALKRSLKK